MIKIKNTAKHRPLFFSDSVQKTVAYFLILLFLFSDSGFAHPHPEKHFHSRELTFNSPGEILASLSLPEQLGAVSESFVPQAVNRTTPFVIYLQNAHANFESENHIRGLIQHFQAHLGLELVLLEGGEGELDSLLFRSFPDAEKKEGILKDYLQKGELSGGEAASITGENDSTVYYGIEQQAVYNENKKTFLGALEKQPEILKELERIALRLKSDSKILKLESRIFAARESAFYAESLDLLRYAAALRKLFYHRYRRQERVNTAFASLFPELDRLFRIKAQEEKASPNSLEGTLSSFQGSRIFAELETLEENLRKALPRSAVEQALLQDFYSLRLLKRLARFALTREEWRVVRSVVPGTQSTSKAGFRWIMDYGLWTAHLDFYALALKRDQILFENASRMIRQKKAKIAAIVTGGFHTEGITQQLQATNIPYAVISPKITEVGPDTNYIRAMTGKNSFMRYFKNNLWEAFAVDYGHKALASLSESDRPLILKRWRDQIIQNAIHAEKVTEAGSYTRYVDALITPERQANPKSSFEQARQITEKRLQIFGAGLKEMWAKGNINPRSLEQVFQRMNTVSPSHLGQDLALIPGKRPLVFKMPAVRLRSEIRSQRHDREDVNGVQEKPQIDESVRGKRNQAWQILKAAHSNKHYRDFFNRMWGSFTLNHLEAKSVTADRLADQIKRIYRLFQNHIADTSHSIKVEIFNPVFSSDPGGIMQAGHSEVLIVAQEREGLDSDITSIFRDEKINIEQSFTSKITFPQTGQKIIVYIYEVKHHGNILGEFENAAVLERLKNIPAKADTNGHTETALKGMPHSRKVVLGEIAVLRERAGGIADVAYDIFGELRGDISDLGNAGEIEGILVRDRAEFNAAMDQMIRDETFFSEAYPEGQTGLTDQAIAFLDDIKTQTLRRTHEPINYDHPHRQSALNTLLDIVREKIEQARRSNTTVDGLSIAVVEAIQDRIVTQLHQKHRLYDENANEQLQGNEVEKEVKRFEDALKQALDAKTMDPKTIERLKGIQFFIEEKGGIKDAVIQKIRKNGVFARFAIADVVIPKVAALSADKWEKMQLNAKDIQKIFTNAIRSLNGEEDQAHGKPLVGVQTGNNLVLFARHVDPFEVLRLVQEFPSIAAIVSDEGSYSAHWALVAENHGILVSIIDPEFRAAMNILDPALVGTTVIVDGAGKVIVDPSEATQEKYRKRIDDQNTLNKIALQHAGEEAKTEDGQIIHVLANADNAEEVHDAMDNGAEGVGLVRTEYLFREDNEFLKAYLKDPTPANRITLVNYFKEIFTEMSIQTRKGDLTIRMFDLERDKKSFLDQPEYNPENAYGLEYYWTSIGRALLEIEIEAALKANLTSTRGQIKILFPMNQAPEDLAQKLNNRKNLLNLTRAEEQLLNEITVMNVNFLNETLDKIIRDVQEELREDLKKAGVIEERVKKIQRGFMVETPEGVTILSHILERADFISIGTNDLTIGLFRDLRRVNFPGMFFFFKERFPAFYAPLYFLIYQILRPIWSIFVNAIPIFQEIEKNLFYFLPAVEGISRDRAEDAQYLNKLQPRVLEAVRRVALQVAKKNLSLEKAGLAKKIPLCVCGALAGSDAFALYTAYALSAGVSIELSASGASIPPLKQFIRGIHHSHTALFKRMSRPQFDLHAEASRQAAVITKQQQQKQLQEYEENERLRQIQETNIPPAPEDSLTLEEERAIALQEEEVMTEAAGEARAAPETRNYIVNNFEGLHMAPLGMIGQVVKANPQLKAFIVKEGERIDIKDPNPLALLMAASAKGTQLMVELTGPDFDVQETFKKLENLEENGEKLFAPAGTPEGQETQPARSELRSDSPEDETGFRALMDEVLDREKIKKRTNHEWVKLHKRFFQYFRDDEKTPYNPEKKARETVLRRLYAGDQKANKGMMMGSLTQGALKDKVLWLYDLHKLYNVKSGSKWFLLGLSSQVARYLAGQKAEEQFPISKNPVILDSSLLPFEYLTRFKEWLLYYNRKEDFLYEPMMLIPGYFQFEESTPKNPKESFAINSILAANAAGLEPAIRPFPELAYALVENGVESVEYLAPHPEYTAVNPPAIYIRFRNPLQSPSGEKFKGVAAAVLQNPLPEFHPESPESLNEVRFSSENDVWMKNLDLTFAEGAPIEERIFKLGKILELAVKNQLILRVDYAYFSREGVKKLASFLGRTEEERKSIERDFEIIIEREASFPDAAGNRFYREPVTPQKIKEVQDYFEKWAERARVLDAFGASDVAFEKGAGQRVEIIQNKPELAGLYANPFYRPLVNLLFARKGDQWLMDQRDNGQFAKRLNEAAPILSSSYGLIENFKSSFEDPTDQNTFSSELIQRVFTALSLKMQRSFEKKSMEDLQTALVNSRLRGNDKTSLAKISLASQAEFEQSLSAFHQSFRRTVIQRFARETQVKLGQTASPQERYSLYELSLETLGNLSKEDWSFLNEALKPLAGELADVMLTSVLEHLSLKRFEVARFEIGAAEKALGHFPDLNSVVDDARKELRAAEQKEKPDYRRKAEEILRKYQTVFDGDPKEYRVIESLIKTLVAGGSLFSGDVQKRISKISNYLTSVRSKHNSTGIHHEVSELLDLISQNGEPDSSNRSELRAQSIPPTPAGLVELIRARKFGELGNMFERSLKENNLLSLLQVWDQLVQDGKIPRALLNPAEEMVYRKGEISIGETLQEDPELKAAYDQLLRDLRETAFDIEGRIREEIKQRAEASTSTLPIPEVILPEAVDSKSPEWLKGKLAVFLNRKLRGKRFSSSVPKDSKQASEVKQQVWSNSKGGELTNIITLDITEFAETIYKKYGLLLDPHQNPHARETISKRLVPVAVLENGQKIKASLISHEEHFNRLKGSILDEDGKLFLTFHLHHLPRGNYRLVFESAKNGLPQGAEGQALVKMEKWLRQREDGKFLKDFQAARMLEVLTRLEEEDGRPVFHLEVELPFQKDGEGRDWFLLPNGYWIARDRRDVIKNIKAEYRTQKIRPDFREEIKIKMVSVEEGEGYLVLKHPKKSLKDMLEFLKTESRKRARFSSAAQWIFSIKQLPQKKRYLIRRYPLLPLPPFQKSRSELRAKGKKPTKTGRIEDIKVDEKLIVDWNELEEAMQKMPKAEKRMPFKDKRIRREYEKLLFRGLHAGNLDFSQRTIIRNFLVTRNLGLVGDWVNKLGFKGEDVLQNGTIGLMVAIGDYDPTIGQLSTYASWWIKNYIFQELLAEKFAREPRDYKEIRKNYSLYEERLKQALGRDPTIEEIAEAAGVSEERLVRAVSWGMRGVYSLDSLYAGNDESSTFGALLGRMSKGSEEDRELVFKLLSVLSRYQQVIIKMRFGIGTSPHNLREIGKIFNVKHEAIRQTQDRALEKMKRAKEELNTDYFPELVKALPSEDHLDIDLVKTRGIFPSDRKGRPNPEFEKILKKGRPALKAVPPTNGRHYVFEIQKDKKLEKVSIPQIARYPEVRDLTYDLIEHRLRLLLKGREFPRNGKTIHVALDLKDIQKNPRLLLNLPEETLRLRAAKQARAEVRAGRTTPGVVSSLKLSFLRYFFDSKLQRLYDFAGAALDEDRARMLVTEILQRTPVISAGEFFDWKPVWLDTFKSEASKEENLSERVKLLFLAQGFEIMGQNGTRNMEYARISDSLKGIYKRAKEAELGKVLKAVKEVQIDFEGEEEKIPGYLFIPKADSSGGKFPVVMIYHGLTSRKEHPYFDALIKKLIEKDIAVLLTDLPAHGDYTRTFEGLGHFKRYTQAILRYLREQKDFPEIRGNEVSLFGFSFGGHIGLRLLLDQEMEKEFRAMVVMNPPFRDSFLHVPTLREHKPYLEAAFGQTEFNKLVAVVRDFALSEESFAEFISRPMNLKLILGKKDTVIVPSDIQRVRRAFPSENVLFYENQGHYLAAQDKEQAFLEAADFFVQSFQRSELRPNAELRPIAEMICGGAPALSYEQITRAAEILRTEQKNGVSVRQLIRELRVLLKDMPKSNIFVSSPNVFIGDPVLDSRFRGNDIPHSNLGNSLLESLKNIRQNALIEIHIPQALEQAPEDIRVPLMDGFSRFTDNLVRLNPHLKFRVVFSSQEAKDQVRRLFRVADKNIKVISEKANEFTRLASAEPADLIISENFSGSLLGKLQEARALGFNAGSFADQSSIEWTGSGKVTLEQITLAALTTLTADRLKGIVPEPAHPNIFRAEGKTALQGLELAAHRLAVEAAQRRLTQHAA